MSRGAFVLHCHFNFLMAIVLSCFSISSCILTLYFSRNVFLYLSFPVIIQLILIFCVFINLLYFMDFQVFFLFAYYRFLFFTLTCFTIDLLYLGFETTYFKKNYRDFLFSTSLISALFLLFLFVSLNVLGFYFSGLLN